MKPLAPLRAVARVALSAAAVAWMLAACSDRSPSAEDGQAGVSAAPAAAAFNGVDITGAAYARELALPDLDGRKRTLAEFKGKVVVVFFGYTQCPDVCPITMTELAAVKAKLGADGARVQPIFVTVDPERDTPEMLRAYMASFGPDFIALRGSDDDVRRVAKEFRVVYAKVPSKDSAHYTIDHTAGSYLFDKQGRVRVFTRYGAGVDKVAADIAQLLRE